MLAKFPLTVWLEVTRSCNLKCKHCIVENDGKSMTPNDAEKILDMLSATKVFKVYFTGGEPLLWEPLPETVSYANERKIWTLIQTNGLLLNNSMARRLRESEVGALEVTIYGVTNATHDFITGVTNSLDKVLKNIYICKDHGIRVYPSFMPLRHNLHELPKVFEWTIEQGLDLLHIRRYIAKSINDPLKPDSQDLKRTLRVGFKTLKELNESRLHVELEEAFPLHEARGDNICAAALQLCHISVEGKISPCPYLRIFGENVLEQGFENVWIKSGTLNDLRNINKFDGDCDVCKFRVKCKGGCRAAAYYAYSRLDSSDPDCWVVREYG